MRYVAIPVEGRTRTLGTFVVASFIADEREEVDEAVQIVAAVAAAVLLLGSVLAFSIAGRVLAPLSELRDAARSVSGTQMDAPDPGRQRRRARRARRRLQPDARPARGRLRQPAGVHPRRQPRAADPDRDLRGHLELLAEGHLRDEDDRREAIALVTGELDRMSRFVDDLLLLAKAESPDFLQLRDGRRSASSPTSWSPRRERWRTATGRSTRRRRARSSSTASASRRR